jgi:Flp pilus assembly protein TadD
MVKHHARVIGSVILLVALCLGVGLAGVATRGAWAEPAVRLASDDIDTRYDLGVALAVLDRPEDALREFREVLRRAPMDADAHYNVGCVLNSLGRHVEAAQAYREAVRVRPDYANAWGNLGLSAILIGQHDEAREAFERAGALVPGYFESRPIQRHAWEIVSRLGRSPGGEGSR